MNRYVLGIVLALLLLCSVQAAEIDVIVKQKVSTYPLQSQISVLQQVEEFSVSLQTAHLMDIQANTYFMALNSGPSFVIGKVDESQLDVIQARPDVEYVVIDRKIQLFEQGAFGPISTLPEIDERYNFDSLPDGEGVKVAILDTGYPIRDDIASMIVEGRDYTGTNIFDDHGHSTHISAIYGQLSPDAEVYTYKVMVNGEAKSSMIISGIEAGVQNGMDVISLSLGGAAYPGPDPMVDAINWAASKGVIPVVAAGNCGGCGSCGGFVGITTPGIAEDGLTVGAVDYYDNFACFSGPGESEITKPDIMALGTDLALPGLSSGSTVAVSGTSFSTPIVGAFVVDLLSAYKSQQLTAQTQSPVQTIILTVIASSNDYGDVGWDVLYGYGIIDALTAIDSLDDAPIIMETAASRLGDIFGVLVMAGLIVVVALVANRRRLKKRAG